VPSVNARGMRISGGGTQYLVPSKPDPHVVPAPQSAGTVHVLRQMLVVAALPVHTKGGSQ
jgi:hypothetical protein